MGRFAVVRAYGSEENQRWLGFEHREGDIVISTRTKSGTTWMQMICVSLVLGTADLPAPLTVLSPWLDWDVEPLEVVRARLDAQAHRRVIKTHTPLDGLPLDPAVTYVVVARHPMDVAVSLHHHSANLDRQRMEELSGRPAVRRVLPPVERWLPEWIAADTPIDENLDTLPGLLHHLTDAWGRRHEPNVVLVRYEDLQRDLEGEMRRLAARLGIEHPEAVWPALVEGASFGSMRAAAEVRAPDALGVLRDRTAFFRSGRSGEGSALLSAPDLARYQSRVAELAPADLVAWLHD